MLEWWYSQCNRNAERAISTDRYSQFAMQCRKSHEEKKETHEKKQIKARQKAESLRLNGHLIRSASPYRLIPDLLEERHQGCSTCARELSL